MPDNLNLPDYKHFKKLDEDVYEYYKAQVVRNPDKHVLIKIPCFNSTKDNDVLVKEFESLSYLRDFHQKSGSGKTKRSPSRMLGVPQSLMEKNQVFPTKNADFPPIPLVVSLENTGPEGGFALICEYFDGKSLRQYLPTSPHAAGNTPLDTMARLSMDEKLEIANQIADALQFIHGAGYAYLNLCPENVSIRFDMDAQVKVEVQNFTHSSNLIDLYSIKSTTKNVYYMAPEQIGQFGNAVDHRADIYCLGLLLWELFAEEHPFQYDDFQEIALCQLSAVPRILCEVNDNIPVILSELIHKVLLLIVFDKRSNFSVSNDKGYQRRFGKVFGTC